jgi:2,3-bisphosphoglycerate-dependent phosphoglycerate mutase
LKYHKYSFDIAYTSVLKRAIRTLWIIQSEMDLMWVPVFPSWRLNERCFGALQGYCKDDAESIYGSDQIHRWRRGYYEKPPSLDVMDERYPAKDPKYNNLSKEEIPKTESLKDTWDRLMPIWDQEIAPNLRNEKRVLICAHGNTIRALIKHIDNISDEGIEKVEIPTGTPMVYQLDKKLKPLAFFHICGNH